MDFSLLIVCAVAVWRLTHLLSKEDGPFDLIFLLRRQLGQGFFGNLLDCFYCLSLWISFPAGWWLGNDWITKMVCWLALSGIACLLEKLSSKNDPTPPAFYEEDKKL